MTDNIFFIADGGASVAVVITVACAVISAIFGGLTLISSNSDKASIKLTDLKLDVVTTHPDGIRVGNKAKVIATGTVNYGNVYEFHDSDKAGYLRATFIGPWGEKKVRTISGANNPGSHKFKFEFEIMGTDVGENLEVTVELKLKGENYDWLNDKTARLTEKISKEITVLHAYEFDSIEVSPKTVFHGETSTATAKLKTHAIVKGIAPTVTLDKAILANVELPMAKDEKSDLTFDLIKANKSHDTTHKCDQKEDKFQFRNFYAHCKIPASNMPKAKKDYEVRFLKPDVAIPINCVILDKDICQGDQPPKVVPPQTPDDMKRRPKNVLISGAIDTSDSQFAMVSVKDGFGNSHALEVNSKKGFSQRLKLGDPVTLTYGSTDGSYEQVSTVLSRESLSKLDLYPPEIYTPEIVGKALTPEDEVIPVVIKVASKINEKQEDITADFSDEKGSFNIPPVQRVSLAHSDKIEVSISPLRMLGRRFVSSLPNLSLPLANLDTSDNENQINIGRIDLVEVFPEEPQKDVVWSCSFFAVDGKTPVSGAEFQAVEFGNGKVLSAALTGEMGQLELKIPYNSKFQINCVNHEELGVVAPDETQIYFARWDEEIISTIQLKGPEINDVIAEDSKIYGSVSNKDVQKLVVKINGKTVKTLTQDEFKGRFFSIEEVAGLENAKTIELIEKSKGRTVSSGLLKVKG